MAYVEETIHIRDLKIGDIIDSLEVRVIGRELIPASNIRPLSDVHFQLNDGRVLLQRERTVIRCRSHDVTKVISSVALPERILIRRDKPRPGQGTLTAESGRR